MSENNNIIKIQNIPSLIAVHPLVLLSVVDHYNRAFKQNKNRRVLGVLLGQRSGDKIDVTNCYAIPFDEDPKQQNIWFVDHIYHETMFLMFKKVNAREKFIGWYTTGQNYKQHDIQINEVFKKYTPNPILLIVDVQNQDKLALPTEAYCSVEEVSKQGEIIKRFVHLASTVEAFEPEEIGVEHLLREIRDISVNSLTNQVNDKIQALKGMMGKILQIKDYLEKVLSGKAVVKNEIIFNIQQILNLLPNLNDEKMIRAFSAKNNDMVFVLYVCSLTKSIISLHNLINNKLENKDQEKESKKQNKEDNKEKENTKDNVKENAKDNANKQK
ncbi:26S proteasome protein, macropain, putative [Ichthyophthirius multifiliis]|uniref:26S proteasome protein, macropain, putative n=1 Tax=Ichthyophthirius multifiliis TaxID=5932 RepID=G0QJ02_ICHMU|nr:26S proteasome protein, macropain, putative [Ichthyophthirius multifiliis]EGR34795.1 26S proteasome protein, macropain, putative [Ichthyophthirius multifiliis]|eukprot:XP_004040099.1 26S proteasome protein, macropain, putative [Ichthyophthirius multifiliis]